MRGKAFLWFFTLVTATGILVAAFFSGNVVLTLAAFALALVLKRTNKHIALPRLYQEKGIRNVMFEGRARK